MSCDFDGKNSCTTIRFMQAIHRQNMLELFRAVTANEEKTAELVAVMEKLQNI